MPNYIFEPVENDPEAIFQEFQQFMQSQYPSWEPSPAQLDVLMARFFSLKIALTADMVARVMRKIYMWFGATVVNLPPLLAEEATVSVAFVASDTLGHTIPAGADLGFRDSAGDLHLFSTDVDITIPVGNSTITGTATAIDAGEQSNNLTGLAEMVNQFDWLISATAAGPSGGGVNEEDEETYLNRLTTNFGLMAPRPILGPDFALISRNVAGIWRAIGLDNFLPGTNEVQTISHNYTGNGATGGTLTILGGTTAALPFNATAAAVQTAVNNLSQVEPGDVTVTGGPWPAAITFTFGNRFQYTDVASITGSAGTWTGGTTITQNTTTAGVAANFVAENAVGVAGIDTNGVQIGTTKKTELDTYLQGLVQQNFIINVLDPAYTTVDVTATATKVTGALAADVQSRAIQAVKDWLAAATWGIPIWPPDSRGWERKTVIRGQELYTVLNNVQGLDFVNSLTFSNGSGATQDGSDKTIGGIFPLTTPGNIAITVS